MDGSAVLRPLDEAADDIRRLEGYETPDELASAIVAVVAAIERSLRLRLRADDSAPEEHRLTALSADRLGLDEVVNSLRSRDRISLETAGTVHEARAAADRADGDGVRASDADVVRSAADRVRRELEATTGPTEAGAGAAPVSTDTPSDAVLGDAATVAGAPDGDTSPFTGRWMAWVAAALAAVLIIGMAWVAFMGGDSEQDDAVRAFRAGRFDSAAVAFESLLEERPGDVTLMLYLGRSYRRLDRPAEAAEVLRGAVREDAGDAAVRRELGHLFMDLDQPASAIAQYERALEFDPDDPLNWAGLIRALREADDSRAEELLRDAPAEVQAALGGA